jgi:hypothetical protein
METPQRKVFYKDLDFSIHVEDYENKLLLHCDVFSWKPSVLRRGYSKFISLEEYAIHQGYGVMFTVTPNPKFVKLFGGTPIYTFEYEKKLYEVIIWDLKPQHLPLSQPEPRL